MITRLAESRSRSFFESINFNVGSLLWIIYLYFHLTCSLNVLLQTQGCLQPSM
ncbi:hypothetical protein RchiOBHm_Chr1g0372001 [Rosa chinensis]|uniref:Uncharacterized protein n=1 Tax=Rosa chinensis TaxID=74649 RepID=A0A2P6SLP7_ROSCH|nr:hypothetical protein RchiOBHm_Chr1g0372001 [Rosa chinensis]